MSLALRNASAIASTETRQTIVKSMTNTIPQWSTGNSATTKNLSPGQSTIIDLKFNSSDPEIELSHWMVYEKENKHATSSLLCRRGSLNDFSEVFISTNGSSDKQVSIEGKNALSLVRTIISDYFLNMGLNIYEDTSFIRNEVLTTAGVTIPAASSVVSYYPLDPFISFARTSIQGDISTMRIELRMTAAPQTIAEHGKLGKSSTNVALWNTTNLAFNDLKYVRNYLIVKNNLLFNNSVKFLSGVDPKVPIKHTQWKVGEDRIFYTGNWDNTVHVNFKLSDLFKSNKIQFLVAYIAPQAATYDDTLAEVEYSGSEWILWKTRELNGGQEKIVDMTDQRRLRDFELKQYRNMYGRQHLPVELFEGTNSFAKYFLRRTVLNFDYLQEEAGHEVLRTTSTNQIDYDIDFYGVGSVGQPCEFHVAAIYCDEYDYVKAGPNRGTVVKLA
jgi:hypothetical protein